jgi:hypothetical protein
MSNNRILEIDSTYRNRNEWPLPGAFEIPISQTGRKDKNNALDPVSLAVPLQSWTCNNLNTDSSPTISGSFCDPSTISLGNAISNAVIIANTEKSTTVGFQEIPNYYQGLVMIFYRSTNIIARRIIAEYKFLTYKDNKDIGMFTFSSGAPEVNFSTDTYSITDLSNIDNPEYPIFFVPCGRPQINGYTGFLLYNESINEYRNIAEYNPIGSMLYVDTSGPQSDKSGPLTDNWSLSHSYSIRKEPPSIPPLGGSYPEIVTSTISISIEGVVKTFQTNESTIILKNMPQLLENDFYKGDSIRLLPYTYDYRVAKLYLEPPQNESRIINTSLSFEYNNSKYIILTVIKPFRSAPTNNLNVEIMNFSYDNFFPFVYSGSLVSQQDTVCYEIRLVELVLPNFTLSVGQGGRIAFYPYVHVELSNVSAAGGHLRNIIYSNNPNTVKVTFRCPVSDLASPLISTFVKLSCQTIQTIKFKPNDNLFFSVTLPNGQIFDTTLTEFYSPSASNSITQISASFSIRRI